MPTAPTLIRLAALLVLLMFADAATAAQKLYSMTSKARRFIGDADSPLTLPIASSATALDGVIGQITTGGGPPPTVQIWDAQLDRAATPSTDLIFNGNPGDSLQLKTSLAVQVPPADVLVTLKAGGRSGPPTLSFCPGGNDPALTQPPTQAVFLGAAPYNPNCTVIASSGVGGIGLANGLMRYTATANQFGGLGALAAQGTFSLAVLLAAPTPSATTSAGFGQVAFAGDIISGTGVGDPIGAPGATAQFDEGLVIKKLLGYTPSGLVTQVGATLAAIPTVQQTTWGGNLTTGAVMVWVTDGSPTTMVTLTGSDTRTPSGVGNITMVSGTISRNSLTGVARQQSTISFTITPEPTMLAGAGVALFALIGAHQVTRRRR